MLAALAVKSNDLLTKAEKAYDTRQYKNAITCYEQLIKEGYNSDKLFYNLGNAQSNQEIL